MPRHWLSLAIFAALTLLVVMLWESPPAGLLGAADTPREPADTYPSIYLSDVEVIQYNEQGTVSYNFTATQLDHFQLNPRRQTARDYTDITAPYFIFHNPQGPPRYLQARQGHADAGGRTITLTEDVRVWQEQNNRVLSELTTPKLVVKPDDQYAETDKPVKITGADSRVNAVGMKAHFGQDRVELLSRVRGVHESP